MFIVTSDPSASYNADNAQPMVMFDNLFAQGTLASPNLPAGTPRQNATTESTFDYWQTNASPQVFRVTYVTNRAADGAFIAAHTLATVGASLTVEYFNGTSWVTQASYTPTTNKPFGFIWPRRSASGWGLSVSLTGAQIGVAFLGQRVVIPGGVLPDYVPVWAATQVERQSGTSRRGQFFGQRIESRSARLRPSFMDVPYTFARDDLAAFRDHYNDGKAFVWGSAPGVFPEDGAYVWAADNSSLQTPIRAGGEWCGLSMDLEAYIA